MKPLILFGIVFLISIIIVLGYGQTNFIEGNCSFTDTSVYSVIDLFNRDDSSDAGSLDEPSGMDWTDDAAVSIENNTLKITQGSTIGAGTFSNYTSNNGTVYEFDFNMSGCGGEGYNSFLVRDASSRATAQCTTHSCTDVYCYDGLSEEYTGHNISTNKSYTFRFEINISSRKYTAYMNGTKIWDDKGFGDAAADSISSIAFQRGSTPGTFYIYALYLINMSATSGTNRCTLAGPPEQTPPVISDIVCTSSVPPDGTEPYSTSDTTPTFTLDTDESCDCNVSDSNSSWAICSTTGGSSHTCTLPAGKALSVGTDYVYLNCTNTFGNSSYKELEMDITVFEFLLYLDGLNISRKYEYLSIVNLSVFASEEVSDRSCIDLDAPGYGINYSCGGNTTAFLYNISILRQSNFSDGSTSEVIASSGIINISMDNRTEMVSTGLNITSSGTTNQLNLTYFGIKKVFKGILEGKYLKQIVFTHSSVEKSAVNLTYSTAGSNYIYINMSDNPLDLSFELTGYDLDAGNSLDFYEYFNETDNTKSDYNETIYTSYPVGIWDNFERNTSANYDISGDFTNASVAETPGGNGYFILASSGSEKGTVINNQIDLRNQSIIEWDIILAAACATDKQDESSSAESRLYLTDKTNNILIRTSGSFGCSGTQSEGGSFIGNVTLKREDHSTNSWNKYEDDIFIETISTSALDSSKRWSFKLYTQPIASAGANADTSINLYHVKLSGIYLNKSNLDSVYASEGNFTSDIIHITSTNISAVTMDMITYDPIGTDISYYLSANGIDFEEVFDDVRHIFDVSGNNLTYRVAMNATNTNITPAAYQIRIQVVSTSIRNISIDLGDDNSVDYNYTGTLNSTTSPQDVSFNSTILTNYVGEYTPIKISSATAGLIQVDNFKLNSSVNPITLNHTLFEDCSFCQITLDFTGNSVTADALEFDFLGSWNYTATAHSGSNRISHQIQIFYSDFNLSFPKNVNWFDFVGGQNDTNITPYGQSTTRPIRNVSHQGYEEPFDVYVKTNQTVSCLDHTLNNRSIHTGEITLNESWQRVNQDISVSAWEGIWMWEHRSSCTSRFEFPYIFYATVCSDCVYDEDDLDNHNLWVD